MIKSQPWKNQYDVFQMQRMEQKLQSMSPLQEFDLGINSKKGPFKVRLEVAEWEGSIARSMLRIVTVENGNVVAYGSACFIVGQIIEFLYKRDNNMEA